MLKPRRNLLAKRILVAATVVPLLLTVPLTKAEGAAPATSAASSKKTEVKEDKALTAFADPNLEKRVREVINKPTGTLHKSDVANLRSLYAYNNLNISSLQGIEQLDQLQVLIIQKNPGINDLTPLTKLKNLTTLGLTNIQSANFEVIGSMTQLKDLGLSSDGLKDISFLRPLVNLGTLTLMNNEIKDLSVLSGLKKLYWLSASSNQITDISPIRNLNLHSVHLDHNQIIDISPIKDMKELYAVQLHMNKIEDVSALATMSNLYMLDLGYNQIKSYLPVHYLEAKLTEKDFTLTEDDLLQPVEFTDNGLEQAIRKVIDKPQGDLTMRDVSNIQSLDASGSSITSLDGIEQLPQLEGLDLSGNQVKDAKPLQYLTNLRSLRLKGNPIANYDVLRDVYRGLADKDFDPSFASADSFTVNTFWELVWAAESTVDRPGKKVKIQVKNPALQSWDVLESVHDYLINKFPDAYEHYKYASPSEAKLYQVQFKINSTDYKDYSKLEAVMNETAKSIKLDVSQYEHPDTQSNLKAEAQIQSANAEIVALAKQLTDGLDSPMKKLEAIHDWVTENIRYDYDTYNGSAISSQDAWAVLKQKKGNCLGYSNLTAALGRAAGIPTQVVTGFVSRYNSTWDKVLSKMSCITYRHAWNQAYIDGRWVVLDTTWDAALYSDDRKISEADRNYFDPDPVLFASSHTFYVPNPKPDGLKDFYFQLNDKDEKIVKDLAWDDTWKKRPSTSSTFYSTAGHMKDGKVTAVQAYGYPDGTFRVVTLARNSSGGWEIVSAENLDKYLPPTPSYSLATY